jgi:hypothetical protein
LPQELGWNWLEQDEMGGASASTITKVARNQRLNATDQLAREVVQNAWDAAQLFRSNKSHQFSTVFRFVEYSKQEADVLRKLFSTKDLVDQFQENFNLSSDRAALVLGSGSVKALIIEDFGAHGLYGHPRLKKESIMFRALYQMGSTNKDSSFEMSGGSYGLGKSAFISASASNLVIAYSRFEPYLNDKVTRRLIGWTWHDDFKRENIDFEGRAAFGEFFQEDSGRRVRVEPFEDTKADQLAEHLRLTSRDGSLNSLGTSLVLFDPVINPEDLVGSLEQFWWPAIVDPEIHLNLSVIDYQGNTIHPQPRSRKELMPLIRAYEIATQKSDAPLANFEKKVTISLEGFLKVGSLGLVAELPEGGEGGREVPKAFLTRGPRMIIGGLEHNFQPKSAKIHAIFATDPSALEVDKLLKDTEPYAHDRWSTEPVSATVESKRAAELARYIKQQFVQEINSFAKQIAQEAPVNPRRLASFSKIFGKFFGDAKGIPEEVTGKSLPFSIRFGTRTLMPAGEGLIQLRQIFDVSQNDASDEYDQDQEIKTIRVLPKLRILMDESSAGDDIAFTLVEEGSSKKYLSLGDEGAEIEIGLGQKRRFRLDSSPYDHQWTADLQVRLEAVEDA